MRKYYGGQNRGKCCFNLVLTYNYQYGTQTISLDEVKSALRSDFDGATPPNRKPRCLGIGAFDLPVRFVNVFSRAVIYALFDELRLTFL